MADRERETESGRGGRLPRGVEVRDGEEYVAVPEWRPAFKSRMSNVIRLALWSMIAQMLLGAMMGIIVGLLFGDLLYNYFTNTGFFDGIKRILQQIIAEGYIKWYYMIVTGLGFMIVGMGIGLRHALVSGNVAVARLIINPAIEHTIKVARSEMSLRGRAEGVQSIGLTDLEAAISDRIDLLAAYIEGYGPSKFFRRFVSAYTVDYIEEVSRAAAIRCCDDKENPRLNKSGIVKTQDTTLRWIKRHTSRNSFLITFSFIVMPVLGTIVLVVVPVMLSFIIPKF